MLTTCQSRRYLDNRLHEIGQQLLTLKAEGANLPEDDARQVEILEQIMLLDEQTVEKEPEEPDIRSLEGCAKWRMLIKLFVSTNEFQMFIIGAIVVNVLLMATEHFNQPDMMTNILATLNYLFCGIFFMEMVLKLIAFGLVGYLADGFNVFDGFIVIVSSIELFIGGGSGLVVLRTFRLVRVFKLARFLPTLQQQIAVMIATLSGVMSFLVLLFLYMFIFAVLGMFLFGNTFDFEPGVTERLNFDTFLWAITTVFVVLTQEDWNMVLYSGVRAGGFVTSIYFVVLLIMGNYVLLNLFVAILIEGFKEEEDPDAISEPNTPRAIDGALDTVEKWSQVTKSPLQNDPLPAGSGLGFGKRDDVAASFGLSKSRRGSGVSRRRSSIVASEAAVEAAAAVAAASEPVEEVCAFCCCVCILCAHPAVCAFCCSVCTLCWLTLIRSVCCLSSAQSAAYHPLSLLPIIHSVCCLSSAQSAAYHLLSLLPIIRSVCCLRSAHLHQDLNRHGASARAMQM